MEEKFLIVGGDSAIGAYLYSYLHVLQKNVFTTTRRNHASQPNSIFFDLAQPDLLPSANYSHAFICAGITHIQTCETDPSRTAKINIEGTFHIAHQLVKNGCRVIFISSSTVFDGKTRNPNEDAPYRYTIEYGRQKSETERRLLSLGKNIVIVRITKLVSQKAPTFARIIDQLQTNQFCEVFNNLSFCPISPDYLCANLVKIAVSTHDGIFHLSGSDDISYADFAIRIAEKLNADTNLIHPIASSSIFFNPRYAGLGMLRTNQLLNILPENLNELLNQLYNQIIQQNHKKEVTYAR